VVDVHALEEPCPLSPADQTGDVVVQTSQLEHLTTGDDALLPVREVCDVHADTIAETLLSSAAATGTL
jgi:hypothetical protein